ncbi:TonB-dependent receptor [Campylobacter suis]|uniref:TonB-dependent receptor n=1 Tax=Campylobacter suis TaxID=2790657 RepID=A0ABM8Q2A7_9BACT|nr:TonB-dependent receptor [Campylobacter suis]CAD7286893.1 hypothetical protein LMG8286_00593 [Campylobacter suis]
MRKFLLSSLALVSLFGGENIASGGVIKPIKEFAPPPPITPNIAQGTMPTNQFDHTDRSKYYFVTNKLDDSMDKFHLSSGMYGSSFYGSALYRYRGYNFYTILNTHYTKANDYKDGSGKKAGFGYKRHGQNFIIGYLPNDTSELRATLVHDRIDDDKQPQHKMDALKTDRYVAKFDARIGDEALGNMLNLEFIYRDVKREANNHLRNIPQKASVELSRKVVDFGIKHDFDLGNFHNTAGFKISRDRHEGKRYTKQGANFFHSGNRFPRVDANNYQIFDTLSYKFNEFHKLSLGLEYIYNSAQTKSFEEKFKMGNAQNTTKGLWKYIYKKDFDGKIRHEGLGGAIKYEFTPNEKDKYAIAFESLYRVADNMERFNALYGPQDDGWISNPFLKPERHNRIKADFKFASEAYRSYLNSMQGENSFMIDGYFIADDVQDLIIYDRFHSKSNSNMNKNAVITRNVDAKLFLASLGAQVNFARNFGSKLSLFYSYAENTTDDRALYQMRPFELNWQLDYRNYASFGSYGLGTNLRYVAKQTRGDWDKTTGLGIDKKDAAKGFSALDIYGSVEFKNRVGMRLGVNNVFDKNYAKFISGAHVGALDPSVVSAPGRQFWFSFHASF